MSLQQVNLLQAHLTPKEPPLGPTHVGMAWGAMVLVLGGLTAWYSADVSSLETEAEKSRERVAALKAANERARADIGLPEKLRGEIGELQVRIEQQEVFLATLEDSASLEGFAPKMHGLASSSTAGVWLREITLEQFSVRRNPDLPPLKMHLQGSALSASAVPSLLQNLARQAVFKGQVFESINIERDESGELQFSIGDRTGSQS